MRFTRNRHWLGNGFGYRTDWKAFNANGEMIGEFLNYSGHGSQGYLKQRTYFSLKEWRNAAMEASHE